MEPMEVPKPAVPSGSSTTATDALWEFEGANGLTFYRKTDSDLIEAAHRKGDSTVKIKIGNTEVQIDFKAMTQTDITTNKSNKINRITLNPDALNHSWAIWKVSLENGNIFEYDQPLNQAIEKKYKNGSPTCAFTSKGRRYQINFAKMKQINRTTKFERDLMRERRSMKSEALWLWEDDNGNYTAFDKEECKEIEEQLKADLTEFTLSTDQHNYDMDLKKLTQTDQDTKKTRNIRRVSLELLVDSVVWEWEEDDSFSAYGQEEIKVIEDAYNKKNPTLQLSANNYNYTIDLTTMEQTNDDTGRVRSIRRLPLASPLPTVQLPPPPAISPPPITFPAGIQFNNSPVPLPSNFSSIAPSIPPSPSNLPAKFVIPPSFFPVVRAPSASPIAVSSTNPFPGTLDVTLSNPILGSIS